MNPAPDFLNYSPEDVLTMGREMNLEPEALASGLLKHRANVESYGRETAGDPEKFWKGAVQLDKDTDAALEKVRMNAERQALTKALPDQADHVNLAKQLEAGGYDPTQVDEKYHPALEEMKKVRESAAYQMPQRIYGGAIKVGETPLARYALREGSDGQMDVSLQLPDDSQALLRVPKATEEDVKQALVKKREAVQAAFDEEARIRKGMAFDPLGKFTGRDVAAKQRLEAARQDYFNLGKGREKYLMGEYIREELKKPEWADKIGQYAGGTEFVKGLADASISAGALVARIAGDENAMRRFAQGQAELDTALPGSTRRRLEGGVWNDSVSGAQRALGNMAPSMVAGGATRLITGKLAAAGGAEAISELARQQAGRLGVAGASMSAGATGNAYLDTQRQIDAAEANGDQELADRLRMGRDMHAILTGVAEGAVERLGAAQAFNVGKGTLVRTARELGMEALEEPITGGIQRGLVNPVTLGQREDVTGPMAQEALTGLMAAGPLVGGSVAMNHLTGQPVDASQQAPGAMPQAPRSAGPVPVTPAGGTSVSPLGDIAAGTFVPDPAVVGPGVEAAAPAQRQAILQDVPDGPSRFQSAALPQDSVMPPSNPQQEITDPIDAVTEETPALQAGNLATYEGYSGRLQQDGQRWVLEVPNGPVVEIADPAGIASVPPEVANQIRINELRSLPDPVVTESKFTAAGDGTLSLRDERGNTYVPHNDQLLRSVRTDERGRVEVLLRNPKRPGQVIKLVGPQAMQAQEAILDAALNVESQGGKVRYGTSPGLKNLRGGNRMEAGSTALPGAAMDALENMARSAVQAGKKFTAWAREMVSRFGEAIRDYLTHIWMAAKEAMPARRAVNTRMGGVQRGTAPVRVSQSGAVINPFDKLKGGSNIFHKQGEPFRVNSLAVRQILTGSPLPGELVPVLAKTQNEKRAIEQRGAQLGNDLRVSIASTVDRTGMPEVQVNDMVSDMLNGTPGADVLVAALDPVLHERTRSVRVLLDNLSAAVAQTLPNTPLRATIVGNLGSWLRRSYSAFDPASGWNYDNLLKKAAAGEQINGKDAADILNKARRYLRMQPGGPHPASEIEADLRDMMDRNVWEGALMGGAGARKSVSSLMQRKDIAPEIRAVMGEENNPVKRVSSSLSFQAQFIARHHGQMAMRQVGLASELFSTQRGGVYTQEIPVDGPRWSGLGGTWTTPQLWQALQNAQGVTLAGTDLGGLFVETLKAMGNKAKLNRVAMNPDSWLVNMLGNFMSMVQNGDVFSGEILRRIKEAQGTVTAGKAKSGAVINAAAEALHDAQRDMMARLTAAGVLGSSLTLADIEASLPRHLLQWMATDQTHDRIAGAVDGLVLGQSLGRGLGLPGRAVGGVLGAAGGYALGGLRIQGWQQRAANVLMTGPDALARTTGWLTNYEAGLTSGMAPDAAADWATKRTLNTYPNYAALPGLMREGSRLGVLGTFIAFTHEVYRNFGWNVRYAAEELRSGNPALVQRGAQRLAGIGAIGALAGGGLAAILALTGAAGGDDERNKLFRKWYGAPWEKDAVLSFKDFNDKGVTYFNTSYLLPQMTMMELLQAAREGTTPEEGAARVMDRLYEQFIGGSVHLGPLLAAATNTNRAGRPLTYQKGVAGALERADYPLETIMEPGFAAKVEKIVYALRGAEKNGKAYSVEQEFKRVIGLREQTKTWPEMALGAYRDLAEENANIRMQANKEISLNRPGASARAVTEANAQLAALRTKVAEFETDSVKLGVPMPVLMSAKREANMSIIRDVGLQVDGKRVRSLGR